MLYTAELDMAKAVGPNDIADFLTNAAWAVCSTYHIILKASIAETIFGWEMLFNIQFPADRNKIVENRQCQTDCNAAWENKSQFD